MIKVLQIALLTLVFNCMQIKTMEITESNQEKLLAQTESQKRIQHEVEQSVQMFENKNLIKYYAEFFDEQNFKHIICATCKKNPEPNNFFCRIFKKEKQKVFEDKCDFNTSTDYFEILKSLYNYRQAEEFRESTDIALKIQDFTLKKNDARTSLNKTQSLENTPQKNKNKPLKRTQSADSAKRLLSLSLNSFQNRK